MDGFSDDGQFGITIIGFVGSVFSPYYAWSGRGNPQNHCAINVALYGKTRRWAMTERPNSAVSRTAGEMVVGPSAMAWDGNAFTVDINELAVPHLSRIRGRVTVRPHAISDKVFRLDRQGGHLWHPIAPAARIEVALERPAISWRGAGYLDANWGERPLEDDFACWDWSRAPVGRGAGVLYAVERRDGTHKSYGLLFRRSGDCELFEPPSRVKLATTRWGIPRATSTEAGNAAGVLDTLEDGPFYARSKISSRLLGEDVTAMHESLRLDRFGTQWVKMLLPFRMPRALG